MSEPSDVERANEGDDDAGVPAGVSNLPKRAPCCCFPCCGCACHKEKETSQAAEIDHLTRELRDCQRGASVEANEADRLRAKVREQAEEVERLRSETTEIIGIVQRWQPAGSPPPASPQMLVRWICQTLAQRAEKAEAEASEHESRANRWMVQAQHAEAELAAAIKQSLEQHRIVQDLGRELRAANERTERLEEAARPVLSWASQCPPNGEVVQHQWKAALTALREALRPAAPEAKESDCTCGEQWPCPLHGGPPAAPKLTPSKEVLSCHCTGDGHKPDCAFWMSLSEQPDLPLGHEFVPHDTSTRYKERNRATCVLCADGICHEWKPKGQRMAGQYCGQPESAHGRKP